MLLYQQQQYEEAAIDLCTVVENNPNDVNARALRASAYLKANRLDKAEEDIEQLSKQSAAQRTTNVRQLSQELNQRKTQVMEEKRRAEEQLQQSPTNAAALEQKAVASRNLGDYRAAVQASQQLLRQDPDNVKATATLIEVYRELKDTAAAQEVLRRAQQLRVPQDALLKSAPALTPLLRRN
jgi:tetratricopeptide (TPR) repeat protein